MKINTLKFKPTFSVQKPVITLASFYTEVNLMNRPFLMHIKS